MYCSILFSQNEFISWHAFIFDHHGGGVFRCLLWRVISVVEDGPVTSSPTINAKSKYLPRKFLYFFNISKQKHDGRIFSVISIVHKTILTERFYQQQHLTILIVNAQRELLPSPNITTIIRVTPPQRYHAPKYQNFPKISWILIIGGGVPLFSKA